MTIETSTPPPIAVHADAPANRGVLDLSIQGIIYTLIAGVLWYLFYNQAIGRIPSDIPQHLYIINPYVSGNYLIPHPAYHLSVYWLSRLTGLPYQVTSTVILTVTVLATLWLVQYLFSKMTTRTWRIALPAAVATMTVIAIYVPFFNRNMYAGQYSPNIWHSPTMMVVKPLALIALLFFVRFVLAENNRSMGGMIAGSGLLLASTVAKPSFVITFLPALALYFLFFRRNDVKAMVRAAIWSLPSIGMLGWQYLQTYQFKGASYFHDRIVFTFFGVFRLYTPSVLVSTLLVLAFPLAVAVIARRTALRDDYLRLAWLVTFIAFLQAAFLAEEKKFEQGAFGFGYVIALFILYFFSMRELLGWFGNERTDVGTGGKWTALGILLLHLVSGLYYLGVILRGGEYF